MMLAAKTETTLTIKQNVKVRQSVNIRGKSIIVLSLQRTLAL